MDRKVFAVCIAVAAMPAAQAGDTPALSEAVRTAMGFCGDCHGRDGNAKSPQYPKLAGQPRKFLEVQIEKMQKRARTNQAAQDHMWGPSRLIDAAAVKEMVNYYSAQKMTPGTIENRELAARGKVVFRTKPTDPNADACTACHGDEAEGGGKAPRLAGQHRHYLLRQLAAVKASERQVPDEMHARLRGLSDDERNAVAEYLQAPYID